MTYEAAILYAQQRMREIGKQVSEYHFEPVRVAGTPTQLTEGLIRITAFNELYILLYPHKYYGVFILSDNSGYNSDALYQSGVPEFTGQITIQKIAPLWNLERSAPAPLVPKPIPLEFLRVVIY